MTISTQQNRPIFILIAIYLMLGTLFNLTIAIGETPDEPAHMEYVRYLAERRMLPVQARDPAQRISAEAHQPPAYYALGALLTGWISRGDFHLQTNPAADITPGRPWGRQSYYHTDAEAFPYRGLVLAYHLMRGVSTILGAFTIWCVYKVARIIAPQQPAVALLAAGLTAFNPQFLFLTASVNNDNMAMIAVSLMLLTGLTKWQGSLWRQTVLMGLLVGLSALSKYTALAAVPGAILALYTPYLRERRWRALIERLALVAVIAALMSGWWYVRNWQLYGDLLAQQIAMHVLAAVRRYSPWELKELPINIYNMFTTSWGRFGWTQINLHPAIYVALAGLCLAALLGVIRAAWRITRERRWKQWKLMPYLSLALAGAGIVGSVARYHMVVPADQGRLIFPGMVVFAVFLALGLAELAGSWKTWLTYGVTAGLIVLSIGCVIFVIIPAYERPHMLSEAELHPSYPLAARFGEDIALRGFDVSRRTLRPKQSFEVTLYWQALRKIHTNYWLMIQVLDPSGRPLAHSTTLPYLGRYATVLWRPGDLFADRYGLTIVPDALPGAAELVVLFDTRDKLAKETNWTLDDQPVGDRARLTTLRISPASSVHYSTQERPEHLTSARFGDEARLLGYNLPVTSLRAGQTVTLTLYWQAIQSTQSDRHVFVHLLCPDGRLIAQSDGVPGQGWYPTTIWAAGDVIRDERVLEVTSDVSASNCALSVGLYDFSTGNRLYAVDASGQRYTDDRVTLTNLDIWP